MCVYIHECGYNYFLKCIKIILLFFNLFLKLTYQNDPKHIKKYFLIKKINF